MVVNIYCCFISVTIIKLISVSNNTKELTYLNTNCSVGWGCKIHRLLLCREVRPLLNECPGYDTKESNGEVPVMLEPWGIRSTPSLTLFLGRLWPGLVVADRVLSLGQIELSNIFMLNWIAWNITFWNLNYLLVLNWTIWNGTVFVS